MVDSVCRVSVLLTGTLKNFLILSQCTSFWQLNENPKFCCELICRHFFALDKFLGFKYVVQFMYKYKNNA